MINKQKVLREKSFYCNNLQELKDAIYTVEKMTLGIDNNQVELEFDDNTSWINFYWTELETDDEYKERLKLKEEEKNREYKIKYLKLKQEFEGNK